MALYKRQVKKLFLTHNEYRETICFICCRKFKKIFSIQKRLESLLDCKLDTYLSDIRLPKELCASCKRNVYQQTAEKEIDDSKKIVILYTKSKKFYYQIFQNLKKNV